MNLNDSLRMIYILAIMFYGFTSIKKLASLLNVDESISPSEENVDEIIEDEIDEEITDEPGDTGETTNEPESDIKNDDEDCIEKYKSAKGDAMG